MVRCPRHAAGRGTDGTLHHLLSRHAAGAQRRRSLGACPAIAPSQSLGRFGVSGVGAARWSGAGSDGGRKKGAHKALGVLQAVMNLLQGLPCLGHPLLAARKALPCRAMVWSRRYAWVWHDGHGRLTPPARRTRTRTRTDALRRVYHALDVRHLHAATSMLPPRTCCVPTSREERARHTPTGRAVGTTGGGASVDAEAPPQAT